MKPLYVKKNGVVYKISGSGMPASYPAANVEYDNTVTSELQATDVQGAIDELSIRQGGVQSDWTENDTSDLSYIQNKPENLVQDANYVHTDNNYDATAKGRVDSLGTASTKDAGVANGVAELDAAGKVPSSQLPSFVDDVIEVADYDHLPITGESGKIYVTLDTNKTYRWTGSGYAEISESLALGETSSTAYRGDRGKTAYDHATETKLSTATASGLYKVAATAQGHISSLTAVTKEDITGLGIPGQDTNTKNTAYGTCDTAGNVKDKVVTLSNATNWLLEVGTIVGVRFTYTNTYTPSSGNNVTLNVNNTGAKNIRYSDNVWSSADDTKCPTAFGEAGQTIYYMYDGTYWVWVSHSKDNDTLYNFKGNEFRSIDGNNYGHETGYGGNANYMVVNGHYYYNSNGPSTDIGASANDGAIYVQALDEDNVTQIAQNYENGNIFVRSKVNGSWTEWKKTIANITANNTVLTTDKTPFLTRQTLNPTGFSGYVREKLVGASYAWNNLAESITPSSSGLTITPLTGGGFRVQGSKSSNASIIFCNEFNTYNGHKYYLGYLIGSSSGRCTLWYRINNSGQSTPIGYIITACTGDQTNSAVGLYVTANQTVDVTLYPICCDLTLAFGSTIADYLYSLTNNGGITKLRDMGCPIDKYTPYGYGLYSVKTSGKKIVGKNLYNDSTDTMMNTPVGYWAQNDNTVVSFLNTLGVGTYAISFKMKINTVRAELGHTYGIIVRGSNMSDITMRQNVANPSAGQILSFSGILTITANNKGSINYAWMYTGRDDGGATDLCTFYEFQIEIGTSATTYEPYSSTTYPLGNDELRGKFDLVNGEIVASGDVKESNGNIDRNYNIVDLGTKDWSYHASTSSTDTSRFSIATGSQYLSDAEVPNVRDVANVVCEIYSPSSNYDNVNGGSTRTGYISITDGGNIVITDTRYNTEAALKTALNGVYLIYKKWSGSVTTEQSTPFADPMSMVGATTEEYIDTRDIPCPVGAERQYMGQSEDVIEIPSSPQSDGKRILISEVSGGKEQVYWDTITKLNYHDYTVKGDGTTTWGDLLSRLKPIYESLSEDEKTYSKLIFRPESISGNECLSYCGAYWYSRIGLNGDTKTLWIDHASLGPSSSYIYYYQKNGDTFTDKTSQTTTYSLSLRVFVEVGNNS